MFKNRSIWPFIPAGLGLLMALGTTFVFHACERKEDGTWMHCHTAQNGAAAAGLVICLLFFIAACLKNRKAVIALNVAGIAAAVVTFLIPGVFVSMCMMQTMRCYAVMQPFVRIVSILIAAASAVNLARLILHFPPRK